MKNSPRHSLFTFLIYLFLLPLSFSANGQTTLSNYKLIDLGTLGGKNSEVADISDDGIVIVGSSNLREHVSDCARHSDCTRNSSLYEKQHAFKYENGKMIDIGTQKDDQSYATKISANGKVILAWSNVIGLFQHENGKITSLHIPFDSETFVNAISANGKIIVGNTNFFNKKTPHAFKYEDNQLTDLGTLGGDSSTATHIAPDGKVIIGKSKIENSNDYHVFKYENGKLTDLGEHPDYSHFPFENKMKISVNRKGHVIKEESGVITDLGGNFTDAKISSEGKTLIGLSKNGHIFRYEQGQMRDLGVLGGDMKLTDFAEGGGILDEPTFQAHFVLSADGGMIAGTQVVDFGDYPDTLDNGKPNLPPKRAFIIRLNQ